MEICKLNHYFFVCLLFLKSSCENALGNYVGAMFIIVYVLIEKIIFLG